MIHGKLGTTAQTRTAEIRMNPDTLFETEIPTLPLLGRGKVRDIYGVNDDHLLIVTTDRLSAYDVILPDPVPQKGEVLTRMSTFWFGLMSDLAPNHLTDVAVRDVVSDESLARQLESRSIVVRRLKPLPVEAVVRGYLIGSGWRDYLETGSVCGIALPPGLRQAEQLERPLFTPATKAAVGDHDENIGFDVVTELVGDRIANEIRDLSLAIYARAVAHAANRGIIIADTKFEFGLDRDGAVFVIDEMLTPDSSRFWPASEYCIGSSPKSYDKQFVRDYLDTLDWDKTPPGPELPEHVLQQTGAKYREALTRITGPASLE